MLKATITPDGQHVHLRGNLWPGEVFPANALPAKIAFYEALRDRLGGRYAQHHAPTVKTLKAAQKMHMALNRRKETTS